MLLLRGPVPDYPGILALLASPDGDLDAVGQELGGATPERRLVAAVLRLRGDQLALRGEDEPAERVVAVERELARMHRRYLCDATRVGTSCETPGALCALDVDRALEPRRFGYPVPDPRSVAALRSLKLHGFRVVLVTSDPLRDLVERCDSYGVYGGLAEHGAVAYEHATGATVSLLPESSRTALEALRATLLFIPVVYVDRGSRAGIRAYNTEGEEPLDPALSDWALAEAEVDDLVAAIDGDRYTDFSASGVDELAGLSDIKLHVGTAGPEQLEYEVAELIGHLPGRCSRCRLPRQSAEAKAFQAALRA